MKKILLLLFISLTISAIRASDTLTIRQVYNFNVGDTFDYQTKYVIQNAGPASSSGGSYYRHLITGKSYSPDSSAVTYLIATLYPPSSSSRIDTVIYLALDSSIIYIDTIHIPLQAYQFTTGFDSNSLVSNTSRFYHTDLSVTKTFIEGLGIADTYYGWGNISEPYGYYDTALIYYSKDTIIRGTPFYQKIALGINTKNDRIEMNISPNPTPGILHLSLTGVNENFQFVLSDLIGKELISQPIAQNESSIDILNYGAGIYVWRLVGSNGAVKTGKVVKE